ncbi:MAG TPA: rhamnogalacturonan lyase B N-terminal domain-containing protein [Verrucomicrobiae bacterium]|nr:rhamnogalacturonan lyase B N-terminal domain-containing protein [Verrucomicrobiae bacterium]
MKIKPTILHSRVFAGMTTLAIGIAAFVLATPQAFGAFGITKNGSSYIVNNGANLVFTVNSSGDMPSCKYKGTELNDQSKASGIASGFGASSITVSTNGGNVLIIKCISSNSEFVNCTHYYIVKSGVDTIYMATYPTVEPSVGELRYIFRGQYNVLPNGPAPSNNNGNTGAIESSDVFGHSNGQTSSKYYGNERAKDLTVKGATGSSVGVFTAFGTRESSSGGPFFHDIENQGDGSGSDQEIYNYMNSGHNQTEAWRVNVLHGPYAFVFTSGSTPSVPDFSFIANLGLTGYVNSSGRGRVVLNGLSGMDTSYTYYMGFANSTAQYWVALSGTGSGECYNMKPGTYTMTIYKNELAVWTGSATVTAGNATSFHTITISGDPSATSTLWRIGDWDGTPNEFLNGSKLITMHPSDARMSNWGPVTFTVGSSSTGSFPAVQFRGDNSPTTIKFNLSSSDASADHTLKIGITCAYNNGRPSVTINGHTLSNPGPSSQPSSRSITIGTYRGNNTTFTWDVPAGDFVTGQNTLTITPISGNGDLGTWLSASWAYDCVELDGTSSGGGGTTYYKFQNHATGLYIDGMGWTTNGSDCAQWSGSASYNQQWAIVTAGSYVRLQNRATGLFLDGMGRTSNGSNAGQWSDSSSYNQQWTEVADGSYTRFQNRATGLFLDGMGRSSDGSLLGQWSDSNSNNQQWSIQAQ